MSNATFCSICELNFNNSLRKKIHEQQVHVFIHQCNVCMTKYKTIEDLETHKKSTHGLENVKDESKTTGGNEVKGKKKKMKKSLNLKSVVAVECVECDELFRSEEDLETHKKKTHPKTVVAVECSVCDELFRSDEELEDHQKSDHPPLSSVPESSPVEIHNEVEAEAPHDTEEPNKQTKTMISKISHEDMLLKITEIDRLKERLTLLNLKIVKLNELETSRKEVFKTEIGDTYKGHLEVKISNFCDEIIEVNKKKKKVARLEEVRTLKYRKRKRTVKSDAEEKKKTVLAITNQNDEKILHSETDKSVSHTIEENQVEEPEKECKKNESSSMNESSSIIEEKVQPQTESGLDEKAILKMEKVKDANGKVSWVCKDCGFSSNDKTRIRRHVKSRHLKSKKKSIMSEESDVLTEEIKSALEKDLSFDKVLLDSENISSFKMKTPKPRKSIIREHQEDDLTGKIMEKIHALDEESTKSYKEEADANETSDVSNIGKVCIQEFDDFNKESKGNNETDMTAELKDNLDVVIEEVEVENKMLEHLNERKLQEENVQINNTSSEICDEAIARDVKESVSHGDKDVEDLVHPKKNRKEKESKRSKRSRNTSRTETSLQERDDFVEKKELEAIQIEPIDGGKESKENDFQHPKKYRKEKKRSKRSKNDDFQKEFESVGKHEDVKEEDLQEEHVRESCVKVIEDSSNECLEDIVPALVENEQPISSAKQDTFEDGEIKEIENVEDDQGRKVDLSNAEEPKNVVDEQSMEKKQKHGEIVDQSDNSNDSVSLLPEEDEFSFKRQEEKEYKKRKVREMQEEHAKLRKRLEEIMRKKKAKTITPDVKLNNQSIKEHDDVCSNTESKDLVGEQNQILKEDLCQPSISSKSPEKSIFSINLKGKKLDSINVKQSSNENPQPTKISFKSPVKSIFSINLKRKKPESVDVDDSAPTLTEYEDKNDRQKNENPQQSNMPPVSPEKSIFSLNLKSKKLKLKHHIDSSNFNTEDQNSQNSTEDATDFSNASPEKSIFSIEANAPDVAVEDNLGDEDKFTETIYSGDEDCKIEKGVLETDEDVQESDILEGGILESEIIGKGVLESDIMEEGVLESGIMEEGVLESGIMEEDVLESDIMEEGVLESGIMEEGGLESDVMEEGVVKSDVLEEGVLESDILGEGVLESNEMEEDVLDVFDEDVQAADILEEGILESDMMEEGVQESVKESDTMETFQDEDLFATQIISNLDYPSDLGDSNTVENTEGGDVFKEDYFQDNYNIGPQIQQIAPTVEEDVESYNKIEHNGQGTEDAKDIWKDLKVEFNQDLHVEKAEENESSEKRSQATGFADVKENLYNEILEHDSALDEATSNVVEDGIYQNVVVVDNFENGNCASVDVKTALENVEDDLEKDSCFLEEDTDIDMEEANSEIEVKASKENVVDMGFLEYLSDSEDEDDNDNVPNSGSGNDLGFLQLLSDSESESEEEENNNSKLKKDKRNIFRLKNKLPENTLVIPSTEEMVLPSSDPVLGLNEVTAPAEEERLVNKLPENTLLIPSSEEIALPSDADHSVNEVIAPAEEELVQVKRQLKFDFESKPKKSWVKDVSLTPGWKMKMKGNQALYKSKDNRLFKSRFNALKYFLTRNCL